jgi:hypothetical protein
MAPPESARVPARMLPELQERDAAGEIAAIYGEIRRFWAVPYVSSLQRHLATRSGWLEWDTYRKTSPEMVVFGRMLGDALLREAGARE